MALQLSDALRNFMLDRGAYAQALQNGKIEIYSGSQPANANAAPTGTLLATITQNAGAHTPEVLAAGTLSLDSGAGGSVNTITASGIELMGSATPYNTSLTQTAADIVTKINKRKHLPVVASSVGATLTFTAKPGFGNVTWTVAATFTTIAGTPGNFAGGTTPVNGLTFNGTAAGVNSKDTSTWSGVAVADGTAGWFRFKGSVADAGSLDGSATFVRMDGTVGTSGANLNLSGTTSIASGATQTVTSFDTTEPAA